MCFSLCFCTNLVELVLDGAGLQVQALEVALLHAFDDAYHQMVVLHAHQSTLSEVDVVRDQVLLNAVTQQPHNLIGVPKKQTQVSDD